MSSEAVLLPERARLIAVPAGRYLLSRRTGGAQDVAGFLLDRDLVTVARYARFVAAGGYEDERFWDEEGWAWREEHEIALPRFWDEPEWRRFLRPARPVVGVGWYEASAFARFEGLRLPSEIEWEAAARGPEGWAYPWGPEWEEGRVAVRGVGPRVTWPAGWFRGAAGPFGHLDLVGNVWQWTSDLFSHDDPEETMACRGGSWASRPDQNRTDHWNGYKRGGRHSHVGFRLAADLGRRDVRRR